MRWALLILTALLIGSSLGAAPQGSKKRQIPVGRLMRTCSRCHMDVHAEWSQSAHAKSWTNPLFQAQIKDREDGGDACARCHAPQSVLETGAGNAPQARSEDRELGVNCVTCHVLGSRIYHGPIASEAHGGVKVLEDYRSSKWCASCHGQAELTEHDHVSSYEKSPAAKKGTTCQECHMVPVTRKMAKAKNPKAIKEATEEHACRKHVFSVVPGEGSPTPPAITVTGTFEDGVLRAILTPHEGHDLLVGMHRKLIVELQLLDAEGKSIGTARREFEPGPKAVFRGGTPVEIKEPAEGAVSAKLDFFWSRGSGEQKVLQRFQESTVGGT